MATTPSRPANPGPSGLRRAILNGLAYATAVIAIAMAALHLLPANPSGAAGSDPAFSSQFYQPDP